MILFSFLSKGMSSFLGYGFFVLSTIQLKKTNYVVKLPRQSTKEDAIINPKC